MRPNPLGLRSAVLWTALLCLAAALARDGLAEELTLSPFSACAPGQALPQAWQPLTFPKISRHTRYTLVSDQDGLTVLRAESHAAASGLIYSIHVEPLRYPWLKWRWKIEKTLAKGNVHLREGDDYAARIYVAFAFDAENTTWWERMRHRTASLAAGRELPGTSLNYIWDNKEPPGTVVNNAYTDQVKMIVLQSGDALAGRWVSQRRNLVEDYQQAFGRHAPPIIAVALMTDTDNTGEQTTAYYGDIVLLSP